MNNTFFHLLLIALFWFIPKSFFSQTIEYDKTGQLSLVGLEKPSNFSRTESKGMYAYWATYFWEFGDGTYYFFRRKSGEEAVRYPKHLYAKNGDYTITLYITPRLSSAATKKISYEIPNGQVVVGRTIPEWLTTMREVQRDKNLKTGRLIEIQATEDNCLIPGDEMRVAVHYKTPVSGKGTLILFYNKIEPAGLKDKIEPLKFINLDPYHREWETKSYSPFVNEIIKKRGKGFNEYKVFVMNTLPKEGEKRLFFSLKSDKILEKKLEKKVIFYLLGIWIPNEGTEYNADNVPNCQVKFELNNIHDPNSIHGPKIRYLRPRHPRLLNYRVTFENNETGVVKNVKIKLPIRRGFVPDSFKLGQTDPPCPKCPKIRTNTTEPCYEVINERDSVVIIIYNIGLFRQKGWFKNKDEYAEGGFDFSIPTDGKARSKSALKAEITFEGAKPIVTRSAVTRWRHRALYLKPGYTFGGNKPIKDADTSLTLNASIAYQNAPIGRGWVRGAEIGLGRLHFSNGADFKPIEIRFPDGSIDSIIKYEKFDVRHLELKITGGYQVCSFARICGGIGILAPTTTYSTRYRYIGRGGIIPETKTIRPHPGWSCQWGVELGSMNKMALGFENQLHIFPKVYDNEKVKFINFNFYLRLKLHSLFGKGR